jgi:hypothetical protein
VLRYGGTWETLDAANRNDARVAQLRKEAALLEGWRPKVEKKKPAGLMPDAATDAHNGKPADDPFVPIAHNNFSRGIKLSASGSTQRVTERDGSHRKP